MSIHELIKNAKSVDFFKELSASEIEEVNLKSKIASAILNKRHELNMNQESFAEYMNVSQSMVSKWESGDYNFSCDSIEQLKKIGITLSLNENDFIIKKSKESILKETIYLSSPYLNFKYITSSINYKNSNTFTSCSYANIATV